MIISFKYKFIFIKTYKTAGSSIESYLNPYLNSKDILAPTKEYNGINCWGSFDKTELKNYFEDNKIEKYNKYKIKYFAHMPIWLVKERLKPLSSKLNYDIFKNFYKFGVIRNPLDTIVSHYYWQNSSDNHQSKSITFEDVLKELEANKFPSYGLLNLNKLMDKNFKNILCDKVLKYENLNEDLTVVFNKLGIPFDGELKIFKKKIHRKKNYESFYNGDTKKLIDKYFSRDIEMFSYNF